MIAHGRTKRGGIVVAWTFVGALALYTFSTPVCGQGRAATARRATVHWNQVPLADIARRVSDTFGIVVFLDRRVDPTTRVSLDLRDADVAQTIEQTSRAAGLGYFQLGALMYLGPVDKATQLRTLAAVRNEEAGRIPVASRAAITQKRPLSWQRLAEPRAIVSGAVSDRGWQIVGAERIPHDLWSSGRLPDLTLSEQLTVLLAGFDLTFRLADGERKLEIVPLIEPVMLTRRYRLRYAESEADRLKQQFPDITMRQDGDFLVADASLENHDRLAEWLAGPATRGNTRSATGNTTGPVKTLLTLRVQELPVRAVLDSLIQKLSLHVDIEDEAIRSAGLSLDRRVSFEVKNASQDELLKALLTPAGLAFRKEGDRIKIGPAK